MGLLRRLIGGDNPSLPEWSPFEDGRTHQAFIEAVEADLRRRGIEFAMEDGLILVHADGEDEPAQYGLANLSQQCAMGERRDWSRTIATHFSGLFSIKGRDLDTLAADYEQVRPILRVRLMPDETMGGVAIPASAYKSIAPGILGVLVYDFPDSTASVHGEHLAEWPVDFDGAFEQGLANLAQEPMPLNDDVEVEPGTTVRIWYGDSFYVATRVLRLADLLSAPVKDALIAVPNRHTLIVHPIVDGGAVPAMQAIYGFAVRLFRDGPGSISDQPYWWHDGELTKIPHLTQGRSIAVTPPDGLVAVLESVLASSREESGSS